MQDLLEYNDCFDFVTQIQTIKVFDNCDSFNIDYSITIAIPTYKRIDTLEEAIESALKQDVNNPYSILVVDNNPERNDVTEVFMQKYRENPKISYYKNSQNIGMAGNFNRCFLLAHSNNVVLLHDDDIISPYALSAFLGVINKLDPEWCIVKPSLTKFAEPRTLSFCKTHKFTLKSLSPSYFAFNCAIGAPTVTLFNKEKIICLGGFNQNYYPSFDYVISARASFKFKTYLMYNIILGGYRVGLNESLSERTMDKYFEMRDIISKCVMKELGFPKFLIKLFQSSEYEQTLKTVCSYYNMPNYKMKDCFYEYFSLPRILKILFFKGFVVIRGIVNFNSKKKIVL